MNTTVLYRKYRPNLFKDVIGQDEIVDILTSSIKNKSESHAYLFTGPRGCGKTSVARLVAKAVNCLNFPQLGEICNDCVNCNSINSGNSIDIIEMDAASNRGIEEIRNLKETVNFLPNQLSKKVYIIDEAHMLTKESFNALLKTLEEPPAHVMFILATTESHKVPVTILSRVMRFDFRFGSKENILTKLASIADQEGVKIEAEALEVIYTHSGGSFRDSESLLGKVLQKYSGENLSKESVIKLLGLIDDSQIDSIINELMNKNSAYILENFDKIFDNDSYLTTFTDQIISRINHRIAQNLKETSKVQKYLRLYQQILELKRNIREFSDKKSALKIELLRVANAGADLGGIEFQAAPTANVEIKVVPEAKSAPLATNSVQGSKQSPSGEARQVSKQALNNASSETRDYVYRLQELISPNYPRIRGVLQTSTVSMENGILVFKNATNYNLQQLSKPEVLDVITQEAKKEFGDGIEIQFSLMSEDEATQKRTEPKEEKAQTPVAAKPEQKPQPPVDNSDLVESIFLE